MFGSTSGANPNSDTVVPSVQDGSLACCRFSPTMSPQLLVAGAWDGVARCWEIQPSGAGVNVVPKAEQKLKGAIFSCSWADDNQRVFLGCSDNTASTWTLGAPSAPTQFAQHQGPVRHVQFIREIGLVCTASFDKTICYWDLRQAQPALKVQLSERCYALDSKHPLLVAGTADKKVHIFDLKSPSQPFKTEESQLKYQTRCIACFPETDQSKIGFAIGSIEGRVGINFVSNSASNYAFKCHRSMDANNVTGVTYPVHDIRFHPTMGTFATVGGDGIFNFWDKDAKQRLKYFKAMPLPIVCCDFNPDGRLFCYGTAYDWGKGHAHFLPANKGGLFVHVTSANEVERRPAQPKSNRR